MMNVLRADMLKLKKSLALKVIFLISGAGAVLMLIVARLLGNGTLGMNAAGNASFLADPQMVALLGTVAAGMFLCGDFENKTVTMQCPEASEEVSWFWGKHFLIF